MQNEISFYPHIQKFIRDQIQSNFYSVEKPPFVYFGIGELKSNLQRMIQEHQKECSCVAHFANNVPPLNLDIFALITNGIKFELLILEVKLVKSAGLKEWSQLIGYCLVSGAKYGLLVNIDNGASPRLAQILANDKHLSKITTLYDGEQREHCLGFMEWNSLTHNFEYSNFGFIKTLSDLSDKLLADFRL